MRYLVAALIRLYQKVSRLTPAVCRFYPTCSCYGLEAVQKYGAVWCGAGRLSRPAPSAALSPVESRRH